MSARQMPAALALGLLASLLAHSVLYGGDHAMGGSYHGILVDVAALAGALVATLVGGLAWTAARRCADGSILAGRLRSRLPGTTLAGCSAITWFALGEAIEPAHGGAPAWAALAVLLAASWLVVRLAGWAAHLVARAVVAVRRTPFVSTTPPRVRRVLPAPMLRPSPALRRPCTRPPPIASICA